MAEIEQQLREVIDRAAAPVTATEVRARVAASPTVTLEESPLHRHRRMLAAAAVLVAVGGISVALSTDEPRNRVDVVTSVPSTTTTPSDSAAATPAMIDIVGLDYRDAEQRVAPLGARVRLSLDSDIKAPNGSVTRTSPPSGEPVPLDNDLVVYVAWDRALVSPGTAVGSNNAFPPVGLTVGFASDIYDERCDVGGRSPATAVRFLHDELVGCMTGLDTQYFVWLDQLDDVHRPIGRMPDLTGLSYDDAVAKFRGANTGPEFVAVHFSPTSSGTAKNPKVIRTVPVAGESITRTMTISLIVDGPLPIDRGGR